jgi:hypothetical protein
MVIARCMTDINAKVTIQGASFGQQYLLKKGLEKFKDAGKDAAGKEMDQLHKRNCFSPLVPSTVASEEDRKSVEGIMFLTEKRDQSIKGRLVYNGKPTREWLSQKDAASPTAALESIFLTSVINSNEDRDVIPADIPNAFIQANMPEVKDGDERVILKVTGVLVDILIKLAPEVYGPYVVFEKGRKVL